MFANGLAVLNNERFLEKSECPLQRTTHTRTLRCTVRLTRPERAVGWGYSQLHGGSGIGPSPGAFKQQTIGLLHAMTYMRCARVAHAASSRAGTSFLIATSYFNAVLRSATHCGERPAGLRQAAIWLMSQHYCRSSQPRTEPHLTRPVV